MDTSALKQQINKENIEMSTPTRVSAAVLALVLAIPITVSPVLWAARASNDSAEITALLADAKSEAGLLKQDTEDMESFTRSNSSWQSYAITINKVKQHVNELGDLSSKLNNARSGGSPWQQDAIDRINPLLKELVTNVTGLRLRSLAARKRLVAASPATVKFRLLATGA